MGGTTRIDLSSTSANWVADWRVETNSGKPAPCVFELDPDLELIDLTGPDVQAYRLMPPGAGSPGRSRVEVTWNNFAASLSREMPITLRAQARVPLAGAWPVPSAHPMGGSGWLGGRTEIRLDPGRVVVASTERSGHRVVAGPEPSTPPAPWIFESTGQPGPLAELLLAAPKPDAAVDLLGSIRLGAVAPRIEVVARWTVGRGRLLAPTLDFPASWLVDRVVGGEGSTSIPWHGESLRNGGCRVHLDGSAWPTELPGQTVEVRLGAIWQGPDDPGSTGSLDLPRVRPTTGPVRVATERWVAAIDPGWEVTSTASHGLVWDDPTPSGGADTGTNPDDRGQTLAWRWVAAEGSASITRRRVAGRPQLDERLEAVLDGGRLRLVWHWTLADRDRPDGLPFGLDLDPAFAPGWRLAVRSGGPVVAPHPLDSDQQIARGLAATRFAGELPTGTLPGGPITLRGEANLPWTGSGSIPLARFPASYRVRRSVVVRVANAARFRVDRADGLRAVARGVVGDPATTPESESSPYQEIIGDDEAGLRVAGAWLGESGADPLNLTVATPDDPAAVGPAGVITEATLISRVAPGSDARHRLVLRVVPGAARTLDLTLPAGATLDRVRRDGQPAVVTTDGTTLRVVLARPDQSRLSSTTTLDYRTTLPPTPSGRIRPMDLLPTTSLACLSFSWQVNAPEQFEVESESPDLVPTDLADQLPRPRNATEPPDEAVMAAMVADLDRALANAPPTETNLGDWLIKLDAGRWPIVVDRLALLGVGLGPRSRVNVVSTDPARPAAAPVVFDSLGLTIEPIGAAFLVTTRDDQRGDGDRFSRSLADRTALGPMMFNAALAGADRSDRFQAPSRWRGEPTPRAWLASETPNRGVVAPGWRSHRFAASTWPTARMAITLADARAPWHWFGLVVSAIAVLVLLVGSIRVAWRQGRPGMALVLVLAIAWTWTWTWTWTAAARIDQDEPIVAIFPYDDLARIDAPPDRVILLEADHARLIRQAGGDNQPLPSITRAIALTHQITRSGGRPFAVVETRQALDVTGRTPGAWSFPVGPALDLSATVDGQPVPLQISPDGRTATVASVPPGRSSVVFRRTVPIVVDPNPIEPGAGVIRLPIPRAAFARVEVEAGDWPGPITISGLDGTGASARSVGPTDLLAIRWGTPDLARQEGPEVRAAVRWNIDRAGDRLTARWTVVGPGPLGSLRLETEPGLAVVSQSIPGLVGITTGGTADRPEWVAHVDPPLRPGVGGEFSFWRPRAEPSSGEDRPIPRWGLVGGKITGLVACRVPEGWSGRLDGPRNAGAPDRADFDLAWGPSVPDGSRLVGVNRWSATRPMSAAVAPEPAGLRVRARVEVKVMPGASEVDCTATFTDPVRPIWEAEAVFDAPIRLVRVESAGLTTWSQPSPNRVRLVFDGAQPSLERSARLEGVTTTESAGSTPRAMITVPWPRWMGGVAEPGKLVVVAPDGWLARAGEAVLIADPSSAVDPTPSYTISPTHPPIQLGGATLPARVNVMVDSNLEIDANQAVWTAQVTSEVVGGSVQTLSWKLPAAWSETARLESVAGSLPSIQAETQNDATVWTLAFDQPVWGRRSFMIRSARPIRPGETLDYPELVPLAPRGRGSVDRYDLAITNLAGSALTLVGPTGLTPLNHARTRSESSAVPGGVVSRAFRVAGDRWALGLRLAPGGVDLPLEPGETDEIRRLARVGRVDLAMTIAGSGQVGGRAECQILPGGAFLAVRLDPAATLVGAMVAGRLVTPIGPASGSAPRRWLIPLGDRNPRRVIFGWVQSPRLAGIDPSTRSVVALPAFDQPAVPTAARVASTREDAKLGVIGGTWTRLTPEAAALDQSERLGADLIESLRQIDQNPTSLTRSRLIDGLVTLELARRAAERRARLADANPPPTVDRWRTTRDRVQAAVLGAGMGSLLDEVNQRIGLNPTLLDPAQLGPPDEVADPFRVRQIGRVEHFTGTTSTEPNERSVLVVRPSFP